MELEGNILQPPAPVVSAATAHKTFDSTDLTSMSFVCTRRVFGVIEHRTHALRSGVISSILAVGSSIVFYEVDNKYMIMKSEIVIAGISGRFPESDNVAEFRRNLYQKKDLVTESKKRWEPGRSLYYFFSSLSLMT
ncbi:hypothetical protein TNCV_4088341 [Trichonephila clavipes]|nr:hypothetical protein TNCV_4088341 [Trichonephila clavipes]